MAIYNEIVDGIFSRLPGGEAIHRQLTQRRGVSAADASRAVTENSPANRVGGGVASPPVGSGTSMVAFSNFLDYFSGGANKTDDAVRQVIESEIEAAAIRHNIDPNLIRAVIRVESSYRPDAVSHAGAMGLMQLMPGTAASLGVTDPFDIRQNINGGTMYLRRMLDLFDNDLELALAAYNAGQGNVRRHGGVPPFRETQAYIPRVQRYFEKYALAAYQQAAEDSRIVR